MIWNSILLSFAGCCFTLCLSWRFIHDLEVDSNCIQHLHPLCSPCDTIVPACPVSSQRSVLYPAGGHPQFPFSGVYPVVSAWVRPCPWGKVLKTTLPLLIIKEGECVCVCVVTSSVCSQQCLKAVRSALLRGRAPSVIPSIMKWRKYRQVTEPLRPTPH